MHNVGMPTPELIERAALAVACIPPGRVVSYGDLAELLGIGARQAGRLMATRAHDLPWWRVTNHAGDLPAPLRPEAAVHWELEGIGWKPNGLGCRIREHRAELGEWARACEDAWQRAGL